jgi:hypothetical protein
MIGPGFAAAAFAQTVKRCAFYLGCAVLVVAIIAAVIGYEVALWRECLVDKPWWFCLHILSSK